MTHIDKLRRRKAMATAVARGESGRSVADRFGVEKTLVYRACREFKVDCPNRTPDILHREAMSRWVQIDWSKPTAMLVAELGVSRQRIHQLRKSVAAYAAAGVAGKGAAGADATEGGGADGND